MSSKKEPAAYSDGSLNLTNALKMNSTNSVTFTVSQNGTLRIVAAIANATQGSLSVNDSASTKTLTAAKSGTPEMFEIEVVAGQITITANIKECHLYYIEFIPAE